jgi:hypothetical protein
MVISGILICCNNEKEVFERIEYYENGNIKNKKVYANQTEYDLNENFILYLYYPNKKIKEICEFKNNKIDGNCFVYTKTGELDYSYQNRKGFHHGIFRKYKKNGNVSQEILYLHDQPIITKIKTQFEEDNSLGYAICQINDDSTVVQKWSYTIDEYNNPIDSLGWWYVINSEKDTINFGEKYVFYIQMLLVGEDTKYCQYLLGEFDENLEDCTVIDTSSFKHEIGKKTKHFIKKYEEGNNFVYGVIQIGKDTIIENNHSIDYYDRFIFYKDFYVKKKNE